MQRLLSDFQLHDDHRTPEDYSLQLSHLVSQVKSQARSAGSEEDLRIGFEQVLRDYLRDQGIEFQVAPRHEVSMVSGRVDALFGTVIIEYKRPGTLSTAAEQERAKEQLKRYILDLASSTPLERIAGFATDGFQIALVRRSGTRWREGDFLDLSDYTLGELIRYLRALHRLPLTPDFLVKQFGPQSERAASALRLFYQRFSRSRSSKVHALYKEWVRVFGVVYGEEVKPKHADLFAKTYGIRDVKDLRPLLFCVHTYFALLIKLITVETLSQSNPTLPSFLLHLPSLNSPALKSRMISLESGEEFSHLQVRNFLEGDFFSWYLEEWNEDLASAVRDIARTLLEFEPLTGEFRPEETRDLLKKLYQYVVPKPIRHDLGEYYTPDWLAELLLNRVGYDGDPTKRILDPACGSGTFLVEIIKRVRTRAQNELLDRGALVEQIIQNVQGFDINPLAVIAARANYLFALGDLRKHAGDINLPVYLTDSILTPSRGSYFPDASRVITSVGTFVLPNVLAKRGRMNRLAAALDESVRLGYSHEEFLERLSKELDVELDTNAMELLGQVYSKITQLEKKGRDRIWARILANAFAPIFVGQFDCVVGNPPWINWEHLAKDYREATQGLWDEYKLSAKAKGGRFELGKMKRDMSMLFTYVCADKYLKDNGALAFLITQTVWKSSGGDVFRRFKLPGGIPIGVIAVDDLSSVRPFEGATNVTSAFVCQKGESQRFPVPYTVWTVPEGPRPDTGSTLAEAERSLKAEDQEATPITPGDNESPWSTSPRQRAAVIQRLVGKSSYAGLAGCTTWANGVYWVKILERRPGDTVVIENLAKVGRRTVEVKRAAVEEAQLFPLLRGRDIQRWCARPSLWIVFPHTAESGWQAIAEPQMRSKFPRTFAYLKGFEPLLRGRAGYMQLRQDHPFYTLVNTNPEIHAPWKLVWKDIATDFTAAVVGPDPGSEKPVIPDHHVIYVGFPEPTEAHYLCAILNSSPVRSAIRSFGVSTLLAPHVLQRLAIPRYDPAIAAHEMLTALSKSAHQLAGPAQGGPSPAEILSQMRNQEAIPASVGLSDVQRPSAAEVLRYAEEAINLTAGEIWHLSREEVIALG